ncbi:cyclic nucleotide-gated ion channel 18-like [Rutidosis leptorrhynchoides]|uniref:cyclic nucleotide-gated ion channel 18-like n=1 Tax=Rutidosis leptorrhynchoides TaxID=125765 RepID=UPI003A98F72E
MNSIINPSSTAKFLPFRRLPTTNFLSTSLNPAAASSPADWNILLWRYQILDPESDLVTNWNRLFLVTSLVSLFIDPLYFFLPFVGEDNACMSSDTGLGVVITFFRTVFDLFYLLHMLMKFRTAYVAPSSRVFGRGELVMDPSAITRRYLRTGFIIDLAATLPLPQILIYIIIPLTRNSRVDHANKSLALFVLIQYVPRIFQIFPLQRSIVKTTGVVAKTAWAGAAYNLLLFMLASHVLGATWYLLSIGRQFSCWKSECAQENAKKIAGCVSTFLDCSTVGNPERTKWLNATRVIKYCDSKNNDSQFKFGMFADAFRSNVASTDFIPKYLYCLWWGLRNLSSYGQTLDTSIYLGETLFCSIICILGLVLFSLLIGNMQTSLQSMTVRVEEWRSKQRDTEEWMRHRQLPVDLQERVRKFSQHQWIARRGVNEESILRSLPTDLRREIQRHLCLSLVRRVPFFSQMDDQLLDAICERLVSNLCTQGNYIVREGDLVSEMLFIIRGQLESSTTDGGRSGVYNSTTLRSGDFCGEELLTWALSNSSGSLPASTQTVKAITEVEAFALQAEDLKFVAHQFKRLQSKKLQHAFKYYSHQWRTWGGTFIQTAWRKYRKRRMAAELAYRESFSYMSAPDGSSHFGYYHNVEQEGNGANSDEEIDEKSPMEHAKGMKPLGMTFLASKFAANTRKAGTPKKGGPTKDATSSSSLKMPQLFKPEEPDFSMDREDV